MCGCIYDLKHLQRSEHNFQDRFSPPTMECGIWIQVMRLVWQMFLSAEPSRWLLFLVV